MSQDPWKEPLLEIIRYVIDQGQSLWRFACALPRDLNSSAVLRESSMLPLGLFGGAVSCESEIPMVWILNSMYTLDSHILL